MRKNRTVIRRHRRSAFVTQTAYIRLVYEMKHSIRSLELQRKIVLIARQPDERSRIGQRHGDQSVTRIEILVRIDNHSTHFIGADSLSIGLRHETVPFPAQRLPEEALVCCCLAAPADRQPAPTDEQRPATQTMACPRQSFHPSQS